jgi:tetratricopeptide (TPR) repeat protein
MIQGYADTSGQDEPPAIKEDSTLAETTQAENQSDSQILASANNFYKSKIYKKALKLYAKILKGDPSNGSALQGAGNCYAALGRTAAAIHYYKLALQNYNQTDKNRLLSFLASKYPETDWGSNQKDDFAPDAENPPELGYAGSQQKKAKAIKWKKIWSLSPEVGWHGWDTSTIGIVDAANSYVSLLKSKGWTNAAETHQFNPGNLMIGVYGQAAWRFLSLGLGYRHMDLGNGTINAQGDASTPFYQYTRISDTQTGVMDCAYLSIGGFDYIRPDIKISINAELGDVWATATEKFTYSTYNGTYSNFYANSSASGTGIWLGLLAGYEYKISEHFSASIDGGYKLSNVSSFTFDSVDTNIFGYPKQGDTVKNNTNGNYSWNLNGAVGDLKLTWNY